MSQAIILAGGMGTRLRARLGDLPKPMISIAGKPLLEHQVELAKRHGCDEILIFACYKPELIEQHLGSGSKWNLHLRYLIETTPRGTAGAVLDGFDSLADTFIVFYGDTMVNVDLSRLLQAHEASGAAATLLLHPNNHPLDSDLVEMDAEGCITAFHNRPHAPGRWFQNLVNAGLYIINKSALAPFRERFASGIVDFGKDLFPAMLKSRLRLHGSNSPEYIKDIGTPERYDKVCAEFAAGVVADSSLSTPQRAIFLDRDGTLIHDRDCLRTAEELDLLPGVAEAVRELNHRGWRAVVITNQPVIAKGWCTEAELQRIHNKLETLLGQEHAFLDRIYFCPHHPDAGFPGERPELKVKCDCRKPNTGMVRRAAAELNIDLSQSWLIGDTTTDIQTARNAGVRSILLRTGYGGRDGRHAVQPDYTFNSLLEAVNFIAREPVKPHLQPTTA